MPHPETEHSLPELEIRISQPAFNSIAIVLTHATLENLRFGTEPDLVRGLPEETQDWLSSIARQLIDVLKDAQDKAADRAALRELSKTALGIEGLDRIRARFSHVSRTDEPPWADGDE